MNEAGHGSGTATRRFTRGPATHGHHRVTFVELFFDLVFVYAITQLSHGLIAHPSLSGVFETLLLAMAVWWVWIYTSWATNWVDPEKTVVRLMLFAAMGAGLVMSMAIPKAFETKALAFALSYVFIQFGRTLFMHVTAGELSPLHQRNFLLILSWFAVSAVLRIGGALQGGTAQYVLWTLAVLIEYAGPAARFFVPGLGHSDVGAWDIEPAHFAERCGLFVIIALGESILVTGATFEKLAWTFAPTMAFIGACLASAAMWWIYFNIGQERGALAMQQASDDRGLIARAYTYVHLVIVLGIVVTAVGDEFVLAHAEGHADAKTLATVIGGPVLYLAGCALFKRATAGWYPLSHLVGMVTLIVLLWPGAHIAPWLLSLLGSFVLIGVAIWERCSLGADAINTIGHPRERARNREAR